MAICIMKTSCFSSRGWLVIDPVGLVGEVGFGAPICSTIRLTETTFVSILDALHRWRTHSLVRWTSIRVACSTRRTLMGAFPQLGTRMEKRATRSSYRGRDQAGATDVILDIKRLLLSPGNTSILPENIVGQSLSVGFRPLPQTPLKAVSSV